MSADIDELIALPLVIVMSIALVASVWIGGNGGDISWISGIVETLAVPALLAGLLLAAGAVFLNKA